MKVILIVVLALIVPATLAALGTDGLQTINLGSKTLTPNVHGTITEVFTPSSFLVDNETVVYLDFTDEDPANLYKGNYEILMNYLNYKLLGKKVYVKDNYAYFDLNGAISSASINEMIQREIEGMIDCQ
jgi:hypothetical protein